MIMNFHDLAGNVKLSCRLLAVEWYITQAKDFDLDILDHVPSKHKTFV